MRADEAAGRLPEGFATPRDYEDRVFQAFAEHLARVDRGPLSGGHHILSIERVGEYPHTAARITAWSHWKRGRVDAVHYGIWEEGFLTTTGIRWPPEKVVGDILLWNYGG